MLESQGWQVETASTAEEATAMLDRTPYQAIVADHNLPGRNGLQFLEAAAKRHPDAACFLFTGGTVPGSRFRVIHKPTASALLDELDRLRL